MEDSPGNLQSDLSTRRLPRPSKRSHRWTLLFVGDHGHTVPIKRFKGLFYLLVGLLLVALGTAGGLYIVNRQTVEDDQRLRAEIRKMREEMAALRYDKEVLTARLVLTEAELQRRRNGGSPPPPRPEAPPAVPAAAEPTAEAGNGDAPAPEPAADLRQESEAEAAPAPKPETAFDEAMSLPALADAEPAVEAPANPVSVEQLAVAHEQALSLLRVTFVIRNIDPDPESVSGHAFVALKPDGDSTPEDWVLMPWAKIESGLPSPARRGQFFSIARFKPMKFEATGVSDPSLFEMLTVFVFNTRGDVLLQQDFIMSETGLEVDAG